jgi:hypothetical protein
LSSPKLSKPSPATSFVASLIQEIPPIRDGHDFMSIGAKQLDHHFPKCAIVLGYQESMSADTVTLGNCHSGSVHTQFGCTSDANRQR